MKDRFLFPKLAAVLLLIQLSVPLFSCTEQKISNKVIFRGAGNWEMPPAFHGNPWAPGGAAISSASWYLYEPLFLFYLTEKKYVPRLAVSMSESADKKTLQVKLRKGVKWHDGHPFTSKDVVSTFAIGFLQTWAVWNTLLSIETPDDHTVIFKWRKPCSHLFKTRALIEKITSPYHIYGKWTERILPLMKKQNDFIKEKEEHGIPARTIWTRFSDHPVIEDLVRKKKEIREDLFKYKPSQATGTGPFMLTKVSASDMVLEKAKDSWTAKNVHIDQISLARWPTNEVMWAFLIAGEIDGAHPATPKEVAEQIIKLNPKTHMVTPSDWAEFGLIFNLKRKPMSDNQFRRAVSYAIDRDLVRKIAYYYGTSVTEYSLGIIRSQRDQWIPREELGKWEKYAFNPQLAAEILISAGYKKNRRGYWCDPEGKQINIEISTIPASDFVLGAESISSQLMKLGIKCTVRIVMDQLYGSKLSSGDFDMVTQFLGDMRRYADPATVFENILSRGGYISTATQFPEEVKGPEGKIINVYDLSERLQEYIPDTEKKQITKTLAWVINTYLPILPIFEKNIMVFYMENKRVSGWPDMSHPGWSLVSGGIEGVYCLFMTEGLLKGARR